MSRACGTSLPRVHSQLTCDPVPHRGAEALQLELSPDDVRNADVRTVGKGKALRPPPALASGARDANVSKCADTPAIRRGCASDGAAEG